MDTTRLHAVDLSVTYGTTHALRGVTLDVAEGESLALMGPSGSGKSTLLHVLAGISPADSGEVWMRTDTDRIDLSAADDAERSALRLRECGFVFQQGLLLDELTAEENVMLPLLLLGQARAAARDRALGTLSRLGLEGLGERRIGQLSGGQAGRVAIARAVVTEPPVVFADEPTGALDSHTATAVLEDLLAVTTGAGKTLVLVTHDPDVAARCSRTLVLRDGRLA